MPFSLSIDTAGIAGIALWSLALYLGCSPLSDRTFNRIYQWLIIASQVLDDSKPQGKPQRKPQEGATVLWASLLSVLPFLGAGALMNYGVELGLGRSWAISVGVIACVGSGVYELGRRDGQASG
ncbi:MAG TPA: hypothetical protein V6D06_04445 [Trichocoleus sp.]